ncbi:MAG: ExbD/TolR family protein [Candidatus Goldiibacteriota bacterium]
MGMSSGGSSEGEPITDINVTPLVDVALVLVIIFMVATPFMQESRLKVVLPKAMTDETDNEQYVTITIDEQGQMSVNEKNVTNQGELEAVLRAKIADVSDRVIVIKADLGINHGSVIDSMETAKKVKPNKIYFATQHQKEGM